MPKKSGRGTITAKEWANELQAGRIQQGREETLETCI
jgi:hypothetical protein